MPEYDDFWTPYEEEEPEPEIELETIELKAPERAVSERVRHGEISDRTRKAAAKIILTLDARRERKKFSKASLARKLGKQPAALRRFFREDGNPELYTLIQIADALGADIVVKPRKKRQPAWQFDPELY
jgi:DNA-binding phage protein